MNQVLVSVLASAGAALGLLWAGYEFGHAAADRAHLRTQEAENQAIENARKGTADAIAKLQPQVQVIQQKVRETVRVEPVYRDCVHPDRVLRDINQALQGPRSGGSVPPADPTR